MASLEDRPRWETAPRTFGRAAESQNWRARPSNSSTQQTGLNSSRNSQATYNSHRSVDACGQPDDATLQDTQNDNGSSALEEGRRLYVGNLPYKAQRADVEDLFEDGDYKVTLLDMAIDPFTSRNPSYCFVELETKEQADRAMVELNGRDVLGRPVKIKLGVPKPYNRDNSPMSSDSVFDRWSREDASTHFKGYAAAGRRLKVIGLPKPARQVVMSHKIREFFREFQVEAISKTICPHYWGAHALESSHYAWVDFPSKEEADAAMKVLNNRKGPWGTILTVERAKHDFRIDRS